MKTARIVGLPYLVLLLATQSEPLYPAEYTNLDSRENVECEKHRQIRQCEPMHLTFSVQTGIRHPTVRRASAFGQSYHAEPEDDGGSL